MQRRQKVTTAQMNEVECMGKSPSLPPGSYPAFTGEDVNCILLHGGTNTYRCYISTTLWKAILQMVKISCLKMYRRIWEQSVFSFMVSLAPCTVEAHCSASWTWRNAGVQKLVKNSGFEAEQQSIDRGTFGPSPSGSSSESLG